MASFGGTHAQSTLECDVCSYVVSYAEQFLQANRTEAEIERDLDMACRVLPGNWGYDCQVMVNNYAPYIIQILVTKENPSLVCAEMGVCKSTNKLSKVVLHPKPEVAGNEVECVLCDYIVGKIEVYAQSNVTESELVTLLDKDCQILRTDKWIAACNTLVNAYAPLIYQYIIASENPNTICTELKICTPASAPKKVQATACPLCEMVVVYAQKMFETNATEEEIQAFLSKECANLGGLVKDCQSIVDNYLPQIWSFMEGDLTPAEVCQSIQLCPKPSMKPSEKKPTYGANVDCELCEIVMSQALRYLTNNATDQDILAKIEENCTYFRNKELAWFIETEMGEYKWPVGSLSRLSKEMFTYKITRMIVDPMTIESLFKNKEEASANLPLLENVVKLEIRQDTPDLIAMNVRTFKGITNTMPMLQSIICKHFVMLPAHVRELAKCRMLSRVSFMNIDGRRGIDITQEYLDTKRHSPIIKLYLPEGKNPNLPGLQRHLTHLQVLGIHPKSLQHLHQSINLTNLMKLFLYSVPSIDDLTAYLQSDSCRLVKLSVISGLDFNWVSSLSVNSTIHTLEIIPSYIFNINHDPTSVVSSILSTIQSSCLSITTLVYHAVNIFQISKKLLFQLHSSSKSNDLISSSPVAKMYYTRITESQRDEYMASLAIRHHEIMDSVKDSFVESSSFGQTGRLQCSLPLLVFFRIIREAWTLSRISGDGNWALHTLSLISKELFHYISSTLYTRCRWKIDTRHHILRPACIMKRITHMIVHPLTIEVMNKTRDEASMNIPLLENVEKLEIRGNDGEVVSKRSFKALMVAMPRLRSIVCHNIQLPCDYAKYFEKCQSLSSVNIATLSGQTLDISQESLSHLLARYTPFSKLYLPKKHTIDTNSLLLLHLKHLQVLGINYTLFTSYHCNMFNLTKLILYSDPNNHAFSGYIKSPKCKLAHLAVIFHSYLPWLSSLSGNNSIHTLELIPLHSLDSQREVTIAIDQLSSCVSITTLICYFSGFKQSVKVPPPNSAFQLSSISNIKEPVPFESDSNYRSHKVYYKRITIAK
eukprot:gene2476-2817_t